MEYPVVMWTPATDKEQSAVLLYDSSPGAHLTVSTGNCQMASAHEADVYSSLQHIRMQLEGVGILLLCNASRRNVRPSGLARQMGAGRKAYKLSMAIRPSFDDLVDVFDVAPKEDVCTIAEQEEYYQAWLQSF